MDKFNIVLIMGCVIFLIIYYWKQYKKWQKEQEGLSWPREIASCPDYWVHEGNHVCRNVHNLGGCPKGASGPIPQGTVDFKKVAASSNPVAPKDMNQKCRWTKRCGSTWEGIDKLCA